MIIWFPCFAIVIEFVFQTAEAEVLHFFNYSSLSGLLDACESRFDFIKDTLKTTGMASVTLKSEYWSLMKIFMVILIY